MQVDRLHSLGVVVKVVVEKTDDSVSSLPSYHALVNEIVHLWLLKFIK